MSASPTCITSDPQDLAAAAEFMLRVANFTPTQLAGLQRYHEISRRVGLKGIPDFVDRFRKARVKVKSSDPLVLKAAYEAAAKELSDLCHMMEALNGSIVPECEEALVKALWGGGATDKFDSNVGVFYAMHQAKLQGIAPPGTVFFTEVSSHIFGRRVDVLIYQLAPGQSPASASVSSLTDVVGLIEVKWYNPYTYFNSAHNLREVGNDLKECLIRDKGVQSLYYAFPQSYERFGDLPNHFTYAFEIEFREMMLNDPDYLGRLAGLADGVDPVDADGSPLPAVEAYFDAVEADFQSWLATGMILVVPDDLP